jgi:hypothetical protein
MDDPAYSPIGPEILDCEISTICHGIHGKACTHCYKSNNAIGKFMSVSDFQRILNKMKGNLTQVALGVGDIDYNIPALHAILYYCRNNNIVPNITINGDRLTDEITDLLAEYCGAVSVSRYWDTDLCYNAVKKLTDSGIKQVNIHQLVAKETIVDAYDAIADCHWDSRLESLAHLTFLLLKPKGARNGLTPIRHLLSLIHLIAYAAFNKVPIGFDSCFAPSVLTALRTMDAELYIKNLNFIEPCESALFSSYVNVNGDFFPCSFAEGEGEWRDGLSVLNCNDFLVDIWFNEKVRQWRERIKLENCTNTLCELTKECRSCSIFPIDLCGRTYI